MKCDFSKNEFLPGFVSFGGGRYMCPGRWYALQELHIFISTLFHKYNMTLESKFPEPVSGCLIIFTSPNTSNIQVCKFKHNSSRIRSCLHNIRNIGQAIPIFISVEPRNYSSYQERKLGNFFSRMFVTLKKLKSCFILLKMK